MDGPPNFGSADWKGLGQRVELASSEGVPGRGIPTVMIPTTRRHRIRIDAQRYRAFLPEKNHKVGIVSPYFMPTGLVLDRGSLTLKGISAQNQISPPSTAWDIFLCHLLGYVLSRKKSNPIEAT
jgi:hypothetical protein